MRKILKLLLFIFFYSATISINAQDKFAVLVAVNDYYENPGVKSPHSLNGCVNDANAVKGLLLNRFGFAAANVTTLFDAKVTKKNFVDLMHIMLQKCKPGDALVFYYSGHGVWMNNNMNADDAVKRGMSQAIVMSNLYASNWDCLVRDETLKEIFNQFVIKKIIVTTIFDCCYSANLMMMPGPSQYWTAAHTVSIKKDIPLRAIPYVVPGEKPSGCRVDPLGNIIDTLDTDGDGVPDCRDWELHSPPFSVVDTDGVKSEVITEEQFLALHDNYYDSSKFVNDSVVVNNDLDSETITRSFNLKDAINISSRSTQARPSEIKNSGFLSIAGSSDTKKGLEITDETGIKHGAFTKALLTVYKQNPADLPVSDLLKKITVLMLQQEYHQNPTYHFEPGRLTGNLIGTHATGFSKSIKAVCTSNRSGTITIDKGIFAGVAKGNIFTDVSVAGKPTVQIINVNNESATAIDKTHGRIKQGHILELADNYTLSNPLVKIYIPYTTFTPAGFNDFFNKKVTPWVNLPNYGDYNFFNEMSDGTVIFCDDATHYHKINNHYGTAAGPLLMYIFLPAPSYIMDACKSILMKDQNIEIVNDANKADYVLYLNYTKDRPGFKHNFVFYFHPPLFANDQKFESAIFSKDKIMIPSLDVTGKSLQALSQKIYELTKMTIRYKTNAWINDYQKR